MNVVAVSRSAGHAFSKEPQPAIRLLEGVGVEGDAHAGVTVQHRSRVRRDPAQANLRQVHLLPAELLAELHAEGFDVHPGDIGENVLTRGVDLLALPTGSLLALGRSAVVEVTGLRNPCVQLDAFAPGLMQAVLDREEDGALVRRAGVMGVVRCGGDVVAGDAVLVTLPATPYLRLQPV